MKATKPQLRSIVYTAIAFGLAPLALAGPPGPTPQVPSDPPGSGAPGAFPNTSVSAVNVVARGSTTFNSNVEVLGFDGNGPIPWSCTKYNRGDFAMRIGVANPAAAAASSLNKGFIDFTSADAAQPESQAWRPHPALGLAIPTARQNGPINWNDGEGAFYPTVAMGHASSGRGYSMIDGSFGVGQLDIQTGRAGTHSSSPEANFSFSVTWFPFDAGWIGGNFGNPTFEGVSRWDGAGEHSPGLTPNMLKWIPDGVGAYGGLAELKLPGISTTNGMIFATSSQGNSDVNIVGVAPTNDLATGTSSWIITIREDSSTQAEEFATTQSQFEFVYVPYNAQNLIGGYIMGSTGDKAHSAGNFSIARTGTGTYELTIPGKRGSDGTLLLQTADFEQGTLIPVASRAFLSYQFNAETGKFVIQSRKTTSETEASLADANFYVAWVDFQNPLSPPEGPRMRVKDAIAISDGTVLNAKEAGLAVNTHEPEILVTTIDRINSGGYTDPTTPAGGNSFAQQALVGYFVNPVTMAKTRGPFFIMGNPNGDITRHDVKYNPVSKEYNVVGNARNYEGGTTDLLMIARVNPNSKAGANEPLLNVFVYDGLTNSLDYDDVSLAVSTKNGNFIVVAEHKIEGESGEGTVGALFGPNGAVLTPTVTRLDAAVPAADEDDPDVIYLPQRDVFLYFSNTDPNRIVGTVVQTTPSAGKLQTSGPEQPLAVPTGGPAQGHPAALENPFNGQLLVAFDTAGNDTSTGELSFYNIGAAPTYTFAEARPQVPYLAGPEAGKPFRHQHPQLAVDPNTGTILIGYQARSSALGYPNGYVFSVLDSNGLPMPSQFATPYYLVDTVGGIDTGANYHNIKYVPLAGAFFVVYTAGDVADPLNPNRVTYVASVAITSSHLSTPVSITATRSGSDLVLTWPTSAVGFKLESKSVLNPGLWNPVTQTPTIDGSNYKVSIPAADSAAFYRLTR